MPTKAMNVNPAADPLWEYEPDFFRLRGSLETDLAFVTSVAVGFPVLIVAGDGGGYRVTPCDEGAGEGPGHAFGSWYLLAGPRGSGTPAGAAAAFVESWVGWALGRRRPGGSDHAR